MTAVIVALALAVAAASGTAVVLAVKWGRERSAAARLELLLGEERMVREQVAADLAARAEDAARYERVVRDLKAEIARLEGDLDACNDPGVVRDRLRRLLSSPEAGRAPSGGAGAGGVRPS